MPLSSFFTFLHPTGLPLFFGVLAGVDVDGEAIIEEDAIIDEDAAATVEVADADNEDAFTSNGDSADAGAANEDPVGADKDADAVEVDDDE